MDDIHELFQRVKEHPDYVFGTIFVKADFPEWEFTDEDAAELQRLEAAFAEAGGRGVELADRIDALRAKRESPVPEDFPANRGEDQLAEAGNTFIAYITQIDQEG